MIGERKFKKQLAVLRERRPSPKREEFIAMLSADCEADVAEFLWEQLAVYWNPITPHPDDNFIEDLAIDHDEPNFWLALFCDKCGIREKDVQDWPQEWPSTIRYYARWLSQERRRLQSDL